MLNELWMKPAVRIQWWLTYLIWSKYLGHRLDPRVSSMYRLRLIRRSHTSPRTIGFDMRPSYCPPLRLVGRVRWADGRVHTMPLSRPYTGTAPILSGETKPLWTRPSGHGGHAQMWGAVSFDQSSTSESRGPKYFQGVLDIGIKQQRWEWWYNSSMTVETGDLNMRKTKLEYIWATFGPGNLKLPILGNTEQLIL